MKWLAVLVALLLLPATAHADVEPNNDPFQAELVTAPTSGTITTRTDEDWHLFYVNGQTQVDVTFTSPGGCVAAYLYDTDLKVAAKVFLNAAGTDHLLYTTPPGVSRVFVQVIGYCDGATYSLSVAPAAALVPGEPAGPGAAPAEPNELATQAFGPLAGGALYGGALETVNDADWLVFHTAGPAQLDIPVGVVGCYVFARLYSGDTQVANVSGPTGVWHLRYSAPSAGTYFLQLTAECAGGRYQVRVLPAEAITATPPPPKVSGSSTSARVRGSKVRVVLKGRLGLPAGVAAARACRGNIVFTLKKGKKLLSARTVKVRRNCRFEKVVSLSRSKVGSAARLNVTARFQGNAALGATTRTFSVRVRR